MSSRSEVQQRLLGIDARRKSYADFARGKADSPFSYLDETRKRQIDDKIEQVKKRPTLIEKIRALHVLMKDIPEDESERQHLLEAIRESLLPRIGELFSYLEEVQIIGAIPPESGFSSEEELETEYEILSYIYAGEEKDLEEIRAFVEQEEMRRSEEKVRVETEEAVVHREKRERPENLPNDFFRFMYANKVPWHLLMENWVDDPTDPENDKKREKFLHEKYRRLGNIFISIILDKMQNDIAFGSLGFPALPKFSVGAFEGASRQQAYTVDTLYGQAVYGTDQLSVGERKAAESMTTRLQNAFNTLNNIQTMNTRFLSAAESLDQLASVYHPIASSEKGQESIPSWFDQYFWGPLIGWEDGSTAELQEMHFMYQDEDGEWQEVEMSIADQILTSYLRIKEISRFPGQTSNQLRVFRPMVGYPHNLRFGTSYLAQAWSRKQRDVWQPKIVSQRVTSPRSIFPYTTEPGGQTGGKQKRIKRLSAIARSVVDNPDTSTAGQSGSFAALNASALMQAWFIGSSMEGQLKIKEKGADGNKKDWKQLLIEEYGVGAFPSDISEDDLWEHPIFIRAVTERTTEVIILGPSGLNLPGYSDKETISGLTAIEKWVLMGKVAPYVLGIYMADKVLKMDQYADKVITDPESQQSAFATRTLGLIKGMIIPFDQYFVDIKEGKTLGDYLEEFARTPATDLERRDELRRKMYAVMGESISQSYALHIKDAITLTKTAMKGLKSGSVSKIATMSVEKNLISDVSEAFINDVRGFYRVLNGYQFDRDSTVSASMEREFFSGDSDLSGLAEQFVVVRVRDHKTGKTAQRLLRDTVMYHMTPQDYLLAADSEAIERDSSKRQTRAEYATPIRGVSVIELVVDDISKCHMFDGSRHSVDGFLQDYIKTLNMRHKIKTFLYAFSGGDELQNLTYEKRLLLGMIFSAQMREKFVRGEYTRGVVSQGMIRFVKNLPVSFFNPEFYDIEIPDMTGPNLFTERGYIQMLHDMGYIRTPDEFAEQMKKATENLPIVK